VGHSPGSCHLGQNDKMNASMNIPDEQEIIKLFEDGDRALMSADLGEIERIYAEDYVQADESGELSTRGDLTRKLTTGKIRFLEMKSTGRRVRMFGDFAIVHGSEEDEIELEGERAVVRYVYMDVVVRCSGSWQIVASQLAKMSPEDVRSAV
jgi:ketosteroid isomerase-like protein